MKFVQVEFRQKTRGFDKDHIEKGLKTKHGNIFIIKDENPLLLGHIDLLESEGVLVWEY